MKTISRNTPSVRMKSRLEDADVDLDLDENLPCGIDQRDIEDLQTVARWFESAKIEFADIDDVFSNYDQLKTRLS